MNHKLFTICSGNILAFMQIMVCVFVPFGVGLFRFLQFLMTHEKEGFRFTNPNPVYDLSYIYNYVYLKIIPKHILLPKLNSITLRLSLNSVVCNPWNIQLNMPLRLLIVSNCQSSKPVVITRLDKVIRCIFILFFYHASGSQGGQQFHGIS